MIELNDEVKETINLIQTDISEGVRDELQYHLACLLEIKRNNLQQLLAEPDTYEHPPYKNVKLDGQVADEVKPLTVEEIKAGYRIDDTYNQIPREMIVELFELYTQMIDEAKPLTSADLKLGGWWCADTSEDTLKAFKLLGLKDGEYTPWDGSFYGCFLYEIGSNLVDRGFSHHTKGLKEIRRIGSEFYWSEE